MSKDSQYHSSLVDKYTFLATKCTMHTEQRLANHLHYNYAPEIIHSSSDRALHQRLNISGYKETSNENLNLIRN